MHCETVVNVQRLFKKQRALDESQTTSKYIRGSYAPRTIGQKQHMILRTWKTNLVRLLVALLCEFVSCLPGLASPSSPESPRLILFIVADQFPARYREHYQELFSGGLRKLFSEGGVFSHARHEHACTDTCPGHATLSTGSPPSKHGIVDNYWFDRPMGREVYCTSDAAHATSPQRLQSSTIGDWLRTTTASSRVYSVSGKDRAAVMLGGHNPSGVFWFDPESSEFTTSSYYSTDGSLLANFRRREMEARYNKPWTPVKQPTQLLARLGVSNPSSFAPHLRLAPSPGDRIFSSPFLDEATADLAEQILTKKRLGQGESLDMLLVSFSALDIVGHIYGPSAMETVDTLVRLDAVLGHLIETALSRTNGRLLIVFSSDHGVQAIPESDEGRSLGVTRVSKLDLACSNRAVRSVTDASGHILIDSNHQETDYYRSLSESQRKQAAQSLDQATRACSWVEAARLPKDFAVSRDRAGSDMPLLYSHSYYPGRGPDVFLQPKANVVMRPYSGAAHGTPYSYDTDVPVVFMGSGITKRVLDTTFPTTRIAPLLAKLSGIPIPADLLDDVSQSQLLEDYVKLRGG